VVVKRLGKRPLGRRRRRQEDSIKLKFRQRGCEEVEMDITVLGDLVLEIRHLLPLQHLACPLFDWLACQISI
jgi:hypothetical protein